MRTMRTALWCEVRREIAIVGLLPGGSPWPFERRPGLSSRGLIVFAALARAIRRKAGIAICLSGD